jgi:hypothetical protein
VSTNQPRPPRKVTCDGEVIEIRIGKEPSRAAEGYGFSGSYRNNVVTVAPNQPLDLVRRSVFAELLHYCFERADLRKRYKITTEEFIVHEFEPWLSQMLSENPALVEFLWPKP